MVCFSSACRCRIRRQSPAIALVGARQGVGASSYLEFLTGGEFLTFNCAHSDPGTTGGWSCFPCPPAAPCGAQSRGGMGTRGVHFGPTGIAWRSLYCLLLATLLRRCRGQSTAERPCAAGRPHLAADPTVSTPPTHATSSSPTSIHTHARALPFFAQPLTRPRSRFRRRRAWWRTA